MQGIAAAIFSPPAQETETQRRNLELTRQGRAKLQRLIVDINRLRTVERELVQEIIDKLRRILSNYGERIARLVVEA